MMTFEQYAENKGFNFEQLEAYREIWIQAQLALFEIKELPDSKGYWWNRAGHFRSDSRWHLWLVVENEPNNINGKFYCYMCKIDQIRRSMPPAIGQWIKVPDVLLESEVRFGRDIANTIEHL